MPLSGIRVVDLTRIIAGPFCAQLLADMGADVIKIEAPGKGDPTRGQGAMVDGVSYYFAQFNRNKTSIAIDLYSDAGKAILARLLADADVLLENYRPGVLDKMGFDQARLDAINPGLIVGSINGYGGTGPYVDRPAFDFIGQAMSGFMSINGPDDGEPLRAGPPISDLLAGLYAAFGVVTALTARSNRADGVGQRVEASLNNSLISTLAYFSAHYFATGEQPKRTGNDHPIVYPYGLFKAKDGDIAVAPSNDIFVERFMQALDLADLLKQPAFATNRARLDHREALRRLINTRTEQADVAHWIDVLNRAGVPAGRVQTLDQVFGDPQVLAQEMVLTCPGEPAVKVTGFPVKLSATPARLRRPPPALGEHTAEILASLGYTSSDIEDLRDAGVI
ncbi:MAG: CoA transferase [Alphaproteobacteria bacterium]|nr:CoA transferase [Alphaproteobacteria bacterium]